MGILDDVVINAKSAAEAVAEGRADCGCLQAAHQRAELNAEISKRYEALGEYVYETAGSSWQRMPRLWAKWPSWTSW